MLFCKIIVQQSKQHNRVLVFNPVSTRQRIHVWMTTCPLVRVAPLNHITVSFLRWPWRWSRRRSQFCRMFRSISSPAIQNANMCRESERPKRPLRTVDVPRFDSVLCVSVCIYVYMYIKCNKNSFAQWKLPLSGWLRLLRVVVWFSNFSWNQRDPSQRSGLIESCEALIEFTGNASCSVIKMMNHLENVALLCFHKRWTQFTLQESFEEVQFQRTLGYRIETSSLSCNSENWPNCSMIKNRSPISDECFTFLFQASQRQLSSNSHAFSSSQIIFKIQR